MGWRIHKPLCATEIRLEFWALVPGCNGHNFCYIQDILMIFVPNFEPWSLDVTGHNFCYIQDILMIFVPNFEPRFLDVTGHNFCYIQDILMIFVPNWSALNSAIFIHWYMHYITISTTEKYSSKSRYAFFVAVFRMLSIFSLPCGPCYNITFILFYIFLHRILLPLKWAVYNLLDSDRKYVR